MYIKLELSRVLLLFFFLLLLSFWDLGFGCILKSGTFGVPGLVLPGHGTAWRKSGTSREIRDGWQPYFGDLRTTYDVHLGLIEKRVVDILLVLIELFSLGVTVEALSDYWLTFRWNKNLDRFFFRFVTMHAFDRQADRQTNGRTEFSSLDRVCIPCSTVKN